MTGQHLDESTAGAVLWHFGEGGYEPGGFLQRLMTAWGSADPLNRSRLEQAFPGMGRAMDLADLPGGIDKLREIAGP